VWSSGRHPERMPVPRPGFLRRGLDGRPLFGGRFSTVGDLPEVHRSRRKGGRRRIRHDADSRRIPRDRNMEAPKEEQM